MEQIEISVLGPILIVGAMLLFVAEGVALDICENWNRPIKAVFINAPALLFVHVLVLIPALDATAVVVADFMTWPLLQQLAVFAWVPYLLVRVIQLPKNGKPVTGVSKNRNLTE